MVHDDLLQMDDKDIEVMVLHDLAYSSSGC